jgi:cytosine/adenosine deaminase-related metal-dependent hydrolase
VRVHAWRGGGGISDLASQRGRAIPSCPISPAPEPWPSVSVKPAAHPIRGDELRALRELQRHSSGGYIFETERGTPFTTDAVNRLIKRIGERAGFPFKVHVHMLRHACG